MFAIKTRQSLYFQTGKERSVDFALMFSERSARPFVARLTGGCADMTAADAIGMRNLTDALSGRGTNEERLPRFAGYALFGGTRMLSLHDPSIVVPGITEIFPDVAKHDCPGVVMYGIVPGFRKMERSEDPKLEKYNILDIDMKKKVITIVHPEMKAVLFVQPQPDNEEIWDDEYKECWKYIRTLHERRWGSLLIVYNGGPVTRRELELWAHWGLKEPGLWNVLLIKDSGRAADAFANDREWLDRHPHVHVAENSVEAINAKLYELGAVIDSDNVITMRRA